MSDSQLGTYQPPTFTEGKKKANEKTESDEFNLLDIDFDDFKNDSNNMSNLDQSDFEIREDLPKIPEKGFLTSKAPKAERIQVGSDEDINANSGNQHNKEFIVSEERDDLEENKANIVQSPSGWMKYLTVDYYKQYFDITTKEVIARLSRACFPLYQGTIYENGKVDLYGPIWVIITLNIAITVFGNMAKYVRFETRNEEDKYKSDIRNLTKSVPIITMYFICMPTFLSLLVKFSGTEHISKLMFKTLSIYGYSFASFIPATFLYIIPFNGMKWIVLLSAAGISLFFLAKEMLFIVRTSLDEQKIKIAAGVM